MALPLSRFLALLSRAGELSSQSDQHTEPIVRVPVPQTQEQVIMKEIPEVQVVERIQEQIAELDALLSVPR